MTLSSTLRHGSKRVLLEEIGCVLVDAAQRLAEDLEPGRPAGTAARPPC